MTRLLLGLLALVLCVQCGDEDDPTRPRPAGVLKLTASDRGTLHQPDAVPAPPPIFSDVCGDPEGWHSARSLTAPSVPATHEDLQIEKTGEDRLALTGRGGAIYRLLEVEPGTGYELVGRSRTVDLEVADGVEHSGGNFYIAELSRRGDPETLFAADLESPFRSSYAFDVHRGTTEWREERLVIETGPDTQSLLVACTLSFPGPVRGGHAEFESLTIRRIPQREMWERKRRQSVSAFRPGAAPLPDWRGVCRTRARVGAESRPSIVLLPGERLEMLATVPGVDPVFEVGLGPWSDVLRLAKVPPELQITVEIDGEPLVSTQLIGSTEPLTWRWKPIEVGLSQWAGQDVTLTFSLEGNTPGAFGAPMLSSGGENTRPNVILISIDTLRADHVGAYGYDLPTTPNLDALARDGSLFLDMTSASAYTLPSHATMLSGQQPSVHGVKRSGSVLSHARTRMLAEIFGRAGYRTRAFTAGGYVSPLFGFDRGFDEYSHIDPVRSPDSEKYRAFVSRRPDLVTLEIFGEYAPQRVRDWVRENEAQPFFLFLHTYTVHDYDMPDEYLAMFDEGCTSSLEDHRPFVGEDRADELTSVDLAHIIHLYDAALRYVDHELGELFVTLDDEGLSDRTIIAVTSDHGEEFQEHGIFGHGHTLYQEMVHVPFILKVPGRAPEVVERPAMLADVAPTLLSAAGVEFDPRYMQGIDMTSAERQRARPIWAEVDEFAHKYALKTSGGWKLIHGPEKGGLRFDNPERWELYDLPEDPAEKVDHEEDETERFEQMAAQLEKLRGEWMKIGDDLGAAESTEIDDETWAHLQQLGYFRRAEKK